MNVCGYTSVLTQGLQTLPILHSSSPYLVNQVLLLCYCATALYVPTIRFKCKSFAYCSYLPHSTHVCYQFSWKKLFIDIKNWFEERRTLLDRLLDHSPLVVTPEVWTSAASSCKMQRAVWSCNTVAVIAMVDCGLKWIRGDEMCLTSSDCAAGNRSLYCTADDGLLNASDISAGSGFFVKYDSRTRNPKFVVQRSVDVSDVSQ